MCEGRYKALNCNQKSIDSSLVWILRQLHIANLLVVALDTEENYLCLLLLEGKMGFNIQCTNLYATNAKALIQHFSGL